MTHRDENGRRNPLEPHAHDEEDSCGEAGQEERNPEEPVGTKRAPYGSYQSVEKGGGVGRQVWHHAPAPPPTRARNGLFSVRRPRVFYSLPFFLDRCMIKIMMRAWTRYLLRLPFFLHIYIFVSSTPSLALTHIQPPSNNNNSNNNVVRMISFNSRDADRRPHFFCYFFQSIGSTAIT